MSRFGLSQEKLIEITASLFGVPMSSPARHRVGTGASQRSVGERLLLSTWLFGMVRRDGNRGRVGGDKEDRFGSCYDAAGGLPGSSARLKALIDSEAVGEPGIRRRPHGAERDGFEEGSG